MLTLKNHIFLCDDDSSSEFPTVEDIKQDPYGEVILRMLKHFKTKIDIRCQKFDGKVEFLLMPNGTPELSLGSVSLKKIFEALTRFASKTCFYNRSLDEVILLLDMLDAGERIDDGEDQVN